MDWLTRVPPTSVEVCGEDVPIRTGWRRAVRSLVAQRDGLGADACWALTLSFFARDGRVPDAVSRHPSEALAAAIAWRDRGLSESAPWGSGTHVRTDPRRLWSWEEDGPLVVADFRRLYGIDLWSPDAQMHWWRFCALWTCAVRTEGSLCSQAVSARGPLPRDADRWQREQARREASVWSLPLSQAEINERIAREW